MALEKPTAEDAKFVNVGIRAFPGDDWLRVGGAVVDDRLGHRDAALPALDVVLQPNSTLNPQQRDFATNVRGQWPIQTMNQEIAAARDKGDFTQARAVFSRYRDRIGKSPQMDSYMQDTDARLEMDESMAKYEALVHDKKNAQARAFAGTADASGPAGQHTPLSGARCRQQPLAKLSILLPFLYRVLADWGAGRLTATSFAETR